MCICFCSMFFCITYEIFVFESKNIDWRLPSIKLVVSIILYGIPSQSGFRYNPGQNISDKL